MLHHEKRPPNGGLKYFGFGDVRHRQKRSPLPLRQEGQIRTRFYKANICIYFDKFSRNIRILLRKFVLPILNICSSKTQRPSSLNFKMILVLGECRQVRTLQARQVPKALKIQASGRVRICPSCLAAREPNTQGFKR